MPVFWQKKVNGTPQSTDYIMQHIMQLLHYCSIDIKATTHNGVKSSFSEHYIKTNLIKKELGRIYSQLFTWRQKGDYDDLFDFERDKVLPYFEPVTQLIEAIETIINE